MLGVTIAIRVPFLHKLGLIACRFAAVTTSFPSVAPCPESEGSQGGRQGFNFLRLCLHGGGKLRVGLR